MTLIMAEDEVLSAAIPGVPKVAEFIAAVPTEGGRGKELPENRIHSGLSRR
jgi:hypothetical protein